MVPVTGVQRDALLPIRLQVHPSNDGLSRKASHRALLLRSCRLLWGCQVSGPVMQLRLEGRIPGVNASQFSCWNPELQVRNRWLRRVFEQVAFDGVLVLRDQSGVFIAGCFAEKFLEQEFCAPVEEALAE